MAENLDNLASFDQYTHFKSIDEIANKTSRVIFSKDAYKHLIHLIGESKAGGYETGCFFMGKEIPEKDSNQIYIDSYTTDFEHSDGYFSGGAVSDTPHSQQIRQYAIQQENYDCMFHFHVHPEHGFYDVFSDKDLEIYSNYNKSPFFQHYSKEDIAQISGSNISDNEYRRLIEEFRDNDEGEIAKNFEKVIPQNRKVTYLGILATPDRVNNRERHNNYQLSVVYVDQHFEQNQLKQQFYRFPNLYYVEENNKMYQVGSFTRKNPPILTSNFGIDNRNVQVTAVGKDPNTGADIEDIEVGTFIDGVPRFSSRITTRDINDVTRRNLERNPGRLAEIVRQIGNLFTRVIEKFKRDR